MARWQLRAAQLVIVDEASLIGTFALDELVRAARDARVKVVLIGDQAQLNDHHTFERTCGRRCLKFMGSGGAGRIRRCRRGNRALSWGRYRIVQ